MIKMTYKVEAAVGPDATVIHITWRTTNGPWQEVSGTRHRFDNRETSQIRDAINDAKREVSRLEDRERLRSCEEDVARLVVKEMLP